MASCLFAFFKYILDRKVQIYALQNRPTNVAVADRSEKPVLSIHNEYYALPVAINGGNCFADCGVWSYEIGFNRTH